PQDQVERPAAADVVGGGAAVVEQLRLGAAGVFEGVGEDGQALEGRLVVQRAGQADDQAVVPGQPGGVDPDGPERVAGNVAEQAGLFAGGGDAGGVVGGDGVAGGRGGRGRLAGQGLAGGHVGVPDDRADGVFGGP